ncbi:MAG: cysteine--tRNA ligase [Rhodospirillales bacterium]|nr:cysteine--tRNA ligase [Alphaproteobacteria bacterium]USO05315.1 MAG: cysteine--tRNA ligase [Rhodospirillales bacterium]
MSSPQFFNSLTRKKEDFVPLNPAHVRLYACGPTVYNYAHIGNARMAVVFDLLTRVLKSLYPKVTYVSNITDVDDKIIASHKATGEPIDVITRKYEKIYNDDMAALGCAAPDIQPRATEHIGEMIAMIEALIEHGHAYEADGHVLFHVPSFEGYGGLSGRSRDEQIAGARVEVASYKKDPADFVLWKPSTDDEPGWDSPWGRGRPGWHIECSAMSAKHLGLPFDIHGGGADLKFPHHENEIAQSCCASGHEDDLSAFAKVWVHNGFVTVDGEKMSKSLGNFLLVHDLIETYPGEALRLTLLSAHYRQPLDWSEDKVQQSRKQLDRFYTRLDEMAEMDAVETDVPQGVLDALCDDLNTPQAMAEMNALLKKENSPELKGEILAAGNLLGILQQNPQEWLGFSGDVESGDNDSIEVLLQERAVAKVEKNFARADEIRDQLTAMGIEILDTSEGTKWRKIS